VAINFIPNDPRAGSKAPAMRSKAKRSNRPTSKSDFTLSNVSPEGNALPGTPQFLFWQCREGALAALQAWEASAGPHKRWQGNRRKLALLQDDGEDLNAFYDRSSFSFFHLAVGATTFFSGASTDVVAHEIGHGLLDSIRPDLWDINFLEVGAFHEAFGDCIAILTALQDLETRQKLLVVTSNLKKRNFVESTAEDLSEGIRRIVPTHNAATPRKAFNTLQYQLPSTLPLNGGPGQLINEVHSFGMIFTGCFWDLIVSLFKSSGAATEDNLRIAATKAGQILIAGAKGAPVSPRFLRSVGRAMVLADETLNGAANRDAIRNAFIAHNVLLGTNAMITPSLALAGPQPKRGKLAASTRKDLMAHIGAAPGERVTANAADVFGTEVVKVTRSRDVDLGAVDKNLKGVVCKAHDPVMVGTSGTRAAIVGPLPNAAGTDSEVLDFVKTLVENGQVDTGAPSRSARRGVVARPGVGTTRPPGEHVTHKVKASGAKKELVRVRFQCGCGGYQR
jgi:hypothetical protein